MPTNNNKIYVFRSENNGSRAQQLGITYFKNFRTLFWINEDMDKRGSDKQGSTVPIKVLWLRFS